MRLAEIAGELQEARSLLVAQSLRFALAGRRGRPRERGLRRWRCGTSRSRRRRSRCARRPPRSASAASSGYKRDSEYSLDRVIRDAHGGLIMVSNDRQLARQRPAAAGTPPDLSAATPTDAADRGRRRAPRVRLRSRARSPRWRCVEAADGLCELLWVADTPAPRSPQARQAARAGSATLVDVAGLRDRRGGARLVAAHRPDGDPRARRRRAASRPPTSPSCSASRSTRPTTARRLTDKFAQRAALAAAACAVPASCRSSPRSTSRTASARCSLDAAIAPRGPQAPTRRGEPRHVPVALARPSCAPASRGTRDGAARDARARGVHPRRARRRSPARGSPATSRSRASWRAVASRTSRSTAGLRPRHPFRETGFFIPSALDARASRSRPRRRGRAAFAALGVTTGCLHTEVKLTADGPVVIEVNGRIGGGVPEMLAGPAACDLLTLAMRARARRAAGVAADCCPPRGSAFLLYVHAPEPSSVVTSIEGVDELRARPGVDEVVLRRGPGDRVDWREGNHGHVLSVFGTAERPRRAAMRCMRVHSSRRFGSRVA